MKTASGKEFKHSKLIVGYFPKRANQKKKESKTRPEMCAYGTQCLICFFHLLCSYFIYNSLSWGEMEGVYNNEIVSFQHLFKFRNGLMYYVQWNLFHPQNCANMVSIRLSAVGLVLVLFQRIQNIFFLWIGNHFPLGECVCVWQSVWLRQPEVLTKHKNIRSGIFLHAVKHMRLRIYMDKSKRLSFGEDRKKTTRPNCMQVKSTV